MYKSDDVLVGARALLPLLPELLGPDAEAVDGQLASYLNEAQQGKKVDNLVLELRRTHEATRVWMRIFLGSTPDLRYAPLPGKEQPVEAALYRCPQCNREWYRRSAASPIPECSDHHVLLEAVENARCHGC